MGNGRLLTTKNAERGFVGSVVKPNVPPRGASSERLRFLGLLRLSTRAPCSVYQSGGHALPPPHFEQQGPTDAPAHKPLSINDGSPAGLDAVPDAGVPPGGVWAVG